MLCAHYNTGHQASLVQWLKSPNTDSFPAICLLQECSAAALLWLELNGWTIFRSTGTVRHLYNVEQFYAAVAIRNDLSLRVNELAPTSKFAVGCLLHGSPTTDPKTKAVLFVSVYLQGWNDRHPSAEVAQQQAEVLALIETWIECCPPGTALVVAGDFNRPRGPWAPSAAVKPGEAEYVRSLMEWMLERNLALFTPPDTITYSQLEGVSSTLDLAFSTLAVQDYHLGLRPGIDHFPVFFTFQDSRPVSALKRNTLTLEGVDKALIQGTLRFELKGRVDWQHSDWKTALDCLTRALVTCRFGDKKDKRNREHETPGWDEECQAVWDRRAKILHDTVAPGERRQQSGNLVRRLDAAAKLEYDRLTVALERAHQRARAHHIQTVMGNLVTKEQWIMAEALKVTKRPCTTLSPALTAADGSTVKPLKAKLSLLATVLFPDATPQTTVPATKGLPGHAAMTPTGMVALSWPELDAAIATIEPDKVGGPDRLQPALLKEAYGQCKEFREVYFHLVDRCLRFGVFPPEWKEAVVSIIPKPGKRNLTLPKSYRPISLLSIAAKVVDLVVCWRLQHALISGQKLQHQYGGVPNVSAAHAIAQILDVASTAKQSRGSTVAILTIDVASAFNRIGHDRLCTELTDAGLPSFANWIQCWLQRRTFKLRMEGQSSGVYELREVGIPQGSPLSPLLWAFYTESLLSLDRPLGTVLCGAYVDDLFAVIAGANTADATRKAQAWLDWVERWSTERNLSLDKPSFLMAVGRRNLAGLSITSSSGSTIPVARHPITVLGVVLTPGLTMNAFIEKKCDRAMVVVGALRRVLKAAGPTDLSLRLRLAQSLILPTLDYCAEVHPITTRAIADVVFRTEKAIWMLVVGLEMNAFTPNGFTMAWELGQHSHVFRWRRACLNFFARCVSLSFHHSASHAREILLLESGEGEEADRDTTFGHANLLDPIGDGDDRLRLKAPRVPALRVAARAIGVEAVEPTGIPKCPPYEWPILNIHIHPRDVAKKDELMIRKSGKMHAVRAYCDGSSLDVCSTRSQPGVAAAYVAYSDTPARTWSGAAQLSPERHTIMDAEMKAILLALESCVPGAQPDAAYWKRVDVFSDSQASLQRLGQAWAKDRKGQQSAADDIRACIHELWATHRTEVHLRWIPGHDDVPGNEEVDTLAKQAAALPLPSELSSGPTSLAAVRKRTTLSVTALEATCWSHLASRSIQAIGLTFSVDNVRTYTGLPVALTRLLLQFRSGTLPTGNHMNRTGCRCSPDVTTSRDHLLLECRSLQTYRDAVTRLLPPSEAKSRSAILQGGKYTPVERRSAYFAALLRLLSEGYAILVQSFPTRDRPTTRANLVQRIVQIPSPPPHTPSPVARHVIDLTIASGSSASRSSAASTPVHRPPVALPRSSTPNNGFRSAASGVIDLTVDTSGSDTSLRLQREEEITAEHLRLDALLAACAGSDDESFDL